MRLCEGKAHCLISPDFAAQALSADSKDIKHLIEILKTLSVISRRAKELYEWKGLEKLCQSAEKIEGAKKPSAKPGKKQTPAMGESVLLNLTQDCMQTCRPKGRSWEKLSQKLAGLFVQACRALPYPQIESEMTRKYVHKPIKFQSQVCSPQDNRAIETKGGRGDRGVQSTGTRGRGGGKRRGGETALERTEGRP